MRKWRRFSIFFCYSKRFKYEDGIWVGFWGLDMLVFRWLGIFDKWVFAIFEYFIMLNVYLRWVFSHDSLEMA